MALASFPLSFFLIRFLVLRKYLGAIFFALDIVGVPTDLLSLRPPALGVIDPGPLPFCCLLCFRGCGPKRLLQDILLLPAPLFVTMSEMFILALGDPLAPVVFLYPHVYWSIRLAIIRFIKRTCTVALSLAIPSR